MPPMSLARFALLLLLPAVSTNAATLSGTVRDSEGAVIANAHLIVHWDPAGSDYVKDNLGTRQDVDATTDSNGHFSIELPPGFYDVFVTATAFTPHCDKIRLKDKEPKSYEVKLRLSPVTSRELD
jgi:Carboxypeptidase regulatory-like domain